MRIRFAVPALLCLLCPVLAIAAPTEPVIHFSCQSNPPTASFIVTTRNDTVTMTMIQSNGSQYMPIFEGIVTPSDIAMLQEEAKFLSQVPAQATFSWPTANCKDNGSNLYECWRGVPMRLGGLDIDSFLFYTHRMSEKVFDEQVDWYRVTFSLEKDHKFHDIVMDYDPSYCDFTAASIR